MRRRAIITASLALLAAILITTSFPPMANVQADTLLANAPRLEGYQIYFSEVGQEASRFDRTDEGLSRLAGLIELLGGDMYTLEWRTGVPDEADLVIIPGPMRNLSEDQAAWLWAYLQNGGRLLLLADPNIKPVNAFQATRGLFQLMWDDMGLRGRDDVVVIQGEPQMAAPPPEAVRGDEPTSTPAAAVEVATLQDVFMTANINTDHSITADLDGELAFFRARSLEVDEAPRETQVTALVYSDTTFYGETEYQAYDDTGFATFDSQIDTPPGALVLAAAMEDINADTRIILVGDREFATNGGGLQTSPPYSASFLYPENIRFLMGAITWLLEADSVQSELTFPTPGPTATPTITPSPVPASGENEGS